MRERIFLVVVRLREMLMPLFLVFALIGCSKPQTVSSALEATVISANTAYALAVLECDAREKKIVARQNSSKEQDYRDLAQVREICDTLYESLENAGRAALAAKYFLETP